MKISRPILLSTIIPSNVRVACVETKNSGHYRGGHYGDEPVVLLQQTGTSRRWSLSEGSLYKFVLSITIITRLFSYVYYKRINSLVFTNAQVRVVSLFWSLVK